VDIENNIVFGSPVSNPQFLQTEAETALEQEKRRTAELEAKLKDLGLLQ